MLKTPWKNYSLRNIKYHTDQDLIPQESLAFVLRLG